MTSLVEQDPSQYLKRSKTFHMTSITVSGTADMLELKQEIHQLCDVGQGIAIYCVEFAIEPNTMEINTSVLMSLAPETMRANKGVHCDAPYVQSNNIIAGFRADMLSTNAFHAQPAYIQYFNPPRACTSNIWALAHKYGGSAKPNGYITFWYKTFDLDAYMESHMIRRFYG